jgi:CheY-like chemotaxis protein
MDKESILIVDDEPVFAIDYRRWLKNDYIIDDVRSAEEAVERLRKKYYSVVLLDLALHITDAKDRSSENVQKYLLEHPEGTKHVIISGKIVSGNPREDDVRTAAIKYKAADVIYKSELDDIDQFREKIKNAVEASKIERPFFYENAYEIFLGRTELDRFEYDVLTKLNPKGPGEAISGWNRFRDEFFKYIAPIYNHVTMLNAVFVGNCAVGLFWSRGLGYAISICIANKDIKEEECVQTLNSWLGWEHFNPIKRDGCNLIGYIFEETDLGLQDFKFPNIKIY